MTTRNTRFQLFASLVILLSSIPSAFAQISREETIERTRPLQSLDELSEGAQAFDHLLKGHSLSCWGATRREEDLVQTLTMFVYNGADREESLFSVSTDTGAVYDLVKIDMASDPVRLTFRIEHGEGLNTYILPRNALGGARRFKAKLIEGAHYVGYGKVGSKTLKFVKTRTYGVRCQWE